MAVREVTTAESFEYVNLISIRGDDHALAGTLFGPAQRGPAGHGGRACRRIPPSWEMVVVRNDDRPGRSASSASIVGQAGINISDMDVGGSPSGEAALTVLSTDHQVPSAVLDELRSQPGILEVNTVSSG